MAQTFSGPLAGFLPGPLSTPHHEAQALPRTSLFAQFGAWRRRVAAAGQLARFDARELRDIGLTDADRVAILGRPLWREDDSGR